MPTESTGLLIIRAYVESGSSSPLRAEIRLTSDVSVGIERTVNLVDPEVVVQVVRTWLDEASRAGRLVRTVTRESRDGDGTGSRPEADRVRALRG